jgi:hypothetical protein
MPRHSEVAAEALRAVLVGNGLDPAGADAIVHRRGSHLHVILHPASELDEMLADTASVRVLAAVRAFDPHVGVIDVSVDG